MTPWVFQKVFRKFTAVDACLNVISVVVRRRFTSFSLLPTYCNHFYYVNYPRRLAIDRMKYSVFFFSVSTFKRTGSINVLTPATPWFVAGLTVMSWYVSLILENLLLTSILRILLGFL